MCASPGTPGPSTAVCNGSATRVRCGSARDAELADLGELRRRYPTLARVAPDPLEVARRNVGGQRHQAPVALLGEDGHRRTTPRRQGADVPEPVHLVGGDELSVPIGA